MDTTKSNIQFWGYTRYVVILLAMICLTLMMSNSVALNFTVICMNNASIQNTSLNVLKSAQNTTVPIYPMFSNSEETVLFSAVPIGTLLGALPISKFITKFGMRKTFMTYGLISAFATLFTPLATSLHISVLFIMRVLQGFAISICFPICGSLINSWIPLKNTATFIGLLSCHIQFGPILTMPLAGELCTSRWGWPALYYLLAILSLGAFCLFYIFFRDSPKNHPYVCDEELLKIQYGKHAIEHRKQKVPYLAMFKDPTVWGVFSGNIGAMLGFYVFMQYGPIYLNKVLKIEVEQTGFLVAIPHMFSILTKCIVGTASDQITCIGEHKRMIIYSIMSHFNMACCFVVLALLPENSPWIYSQFLFIGVIVLSAFNCGGVGKSTQLVSAQFISTISAFQTFASSCVITLLPLLVAVLVSDDRKDQWSMVFYVVAAILVITLSFFIITLKTKPRPWTYSMTENKKKASDKTKIALNEDESISFM